MSRSTKWWERGLLVWYKEYHLVGTKTKDCMGEIVDYFQHTRMLLLHLIPRVLHHLVGYDEPCRGRFVHNPALRGRKAQRHRGPVPLTQV